MKITKNDQKQDSLKIVINGKTVILLFSPDPNTEASNFIKKTLINAYLMKVV